MTRAVEAALCTLAVLAGCGGDQPPATERPVKERSAESGIVVATLGDSITAGTPAWDPDRGVRETLGTGADERSQFQHWAARRDPRLDFRNCGVNRERTDQIARRLAKCADGADAIVIQGGINDIAQGLGPKPPGQNLEAMAERARAMGLRVAIAELLPWNNGDPVEAEAIRALNKRIGRIADRHGATVLPFYETLEDPPGSARMRPDWTADGDHPSIAGYRRLGELAFSLP